MTSTSTYAYGIDYNPIMGVVTRARGGKKGVQGFLSTDPLAAGYPSWTPYAFAMNRVIDGIDIDGLEYTNADEAHYKLNRGQAWLTVSRFNEVYASQATNRSNLIRPNMFGDPFVGRGEPFAIVAKMSTGHIETFNSLSEVRLAAPDGVVSVGSPAYMAELAKNRAKNGVLISNSEFLVNTGARLIRDRYKPSTPSARTRGASKAVGPLAAIMVVADLSKDVMFQINYANDMEQRSHMGKAIRDVNKALDNGLIPSNYTDQASMEKMINFVYSGERSGNMEIDVIGATIAKEISGNLTQDNSQDILPADHDLINSFEPNVSAESNEN